MRFPEPNEDLTGKVCVCSTGRVGIVGGRKVILGGKPPMYFGLGIDSFGNWASTKPAVLAESIEEFHDKLAERFDGKLTYNG